MKKLVLGLILLGFTGCLVPEDQKEIANVTYAIDYTIPPPSDWPRLETTFHKVDLKTVAIKCSSSEWGRYAKTLGCAIINFRENTCVVWYATEDILPHERAHCLGFDHKGQVNTLGGQWNDYKNR